MQPATLRELRVDRHQALVTALCDRLPELAIAFVRLQLKAMRGADLELTSS
jgi:hypothetical protein